VHQARPAQVPEKPVEQHTLIVHGAEAEVDCAGPTGVGRRGLAAVGRAKLAEQGTWQWFMREGQWGEQSTRECS
jgi:hypothetical protein